MPLRCIRLFAVVDLHPISAKLGNEYPTVDGQERTGTETKDSMRNVSRCVTVSKVP